MSANRIVKDNNGFGWNIRPVDGGIEIALAYAEKQGEILYIPECLDDKVVVGLADRACYKLDKVQEIYMPDTIMYLGREAFEGCTGLKKVKLSAKLERIPEWCFAYCRNLTEVEGIEDIRQFDSYAFYQGYFADELVLTHVVNSIGEYAFSECGVKKIICHIAKENGNMIFARCNELEELEIEQGSLSIPDYFVYGCEKLSRIALPNTLTDIGNYSFGQCMQLKTLKFPASVKSLGNFCLYEDILENITISELLEGKDFGEKEADFTVKAVLKVSIDYNDSHWENEEKHVYYGESIAPLPLLETSSRKMTLWSQNLAQGKMPDTFWTYLEKELGEWFRNALIEASEPYNFDKPIHDNITLYAKWENR